MDIKELKELSEKEELSEYEGRTLITAYILYNKGVGIPHVMIARINDKQQFENNVVICKKFFKSFIL